MRKSILLYASFIAMLTSCTVPKGTISSVAESNVDPKLEIDIDEVAIVAFGDDFIVDNIYAEALDILAEELANNGMEVSAYMTATQGNAEDYEALNNTFSELRPNFVFECTPYIKFTSVGLNYRVYTTDIKLIYIPTSAVLWRGYVDIELVGAKVLEDSPEELATQIIEMLKEDGLLNTKA